MTKNHITIDLDMNDGGHINLKNTNLFSAEGNLWSGVGFYIGYWCHFYRYVGEIISNRCAEKSFEIDDDFCLPTFRRSLSCCLSFDTFEAGCFSWSFLQTLRMTAADLGVTVAGLSMTALYRARQTQMSDDLISVHNSIESPIKMEHNS